MTLPSFRYHPDPLATGAIEPCSGHRCPCCGQARGYRYTTQPFGEQEVSGLCPWCIHDGSAARKFDAYFVEVDPDLLQDGPPHQSVQELMLRTPSYMPWQDAGVWPIHCRDFCAYLGQADPTLLQNLKDELLVDLQTLESEYQTPWGELVGPGTALTTYLFRCLACGRHRLHADCS